MNAIQDEIINRLANGLGKIQPGVDLKYMLDEFKLKIVPRDTKNKWAESAMSHLRCAISQSLPTDDQIIYGHMKSALKDIEMLEREQ